MKRLLVGAVSMACVCAGARLAAAQSDSYGSVTPMDVSASSTLKGKGDKYAAWRIFDADWAGDPSEGSGYYTTGWCEGKKDEGIGEYVELRGDDLSFTQLSIAAGFWKSDALFAKNNRPTKLTVIVTNHDGQEQSYDVAVPAGMEAAVLDLGDQPADAAYIKIQIAEVAKGKVNDTCISSVSLVNGDRNLVPFLESGSHYQDLQTAVMSLGEGLTSCDQTKIADYVKFPLSYKSRPSPDGSDKGIKKKWKKMKDLMKSCAKGQVPMLEADDLTWLVPEGPGKVMVRAGGGNEMGSPWWHLTYVYGADGTEGAWKLTVADYQ